jgi:hypothetical protein
MEGKTLEELRKNLVSELGAFQMTMFGTDRAEEEIDALIVVIQLRVETKCKEALVAQGEAWAKECSRQVASAMECGRAEGAEDTETYKKMVAKYVYWKGRYELAVRGMTDKAAVEIMGKEP